MSWRGPKKDEYELEEQYTTHVNVFVRTVDDLERIASDNAFEMMASLTMATLAYLDRTVFDVKLRGYGYLPFTRNTLLMPEVRPFRGLQFDRWLLTYYSQAERHNLVTYVKEPLTLDQPWAYGDIMELITKVQEVAE